MGANEVWKCPKCGRSLSSGGESIAAALGPLARAIPDLARSTDIKCPCGAVIPATHFLGQEQPRATTAPSAPSGTPQHAPPTPASPTVEDWLPGETLAVTIQKAGEETGQGVAYLADGSTVVVEQGRGLIGKVAAVNITSVLTTSAGRMLFGRGCEATQEQARLLTLEAQRRTKLLATLRQTLAGYGDKCSLRPLSAEAAGKVRRAFDALHVTTRDVLLLYSPAGWWGRTKGGFFFTNAGFGFFGKACSEPIYVRYSELRDAVRCSGTTLQIRRHPVFTGEIPAGKVASALRQVVEIATPAPVSEAPSRSAATTAPAPVPETTPSPAPPAANFEEALLAVSSDGSRMYRNDRDEAFRWYEGKGFPNSGRNEESGVRWFLAMSNKADESSLWDEAWGGYHHALAGAIALKLNDRIADICWHLGRSQTALAHYDLAALYLEAGYQLAQGQGKDELSSRILLELAVLGKVSERSEIAQEAYQRADTYLFASKGGSSLAEKAALTLFHEGMKNQQWRRNDKPVQHCLVHATGFYEVSLDLNRRLNQKGAVSIALINLGHVWKMRGERDHAMACWHEALPLLEELNDQPKIASVQKWMNEA